MKFNFFLDLLFPKICFVCQAEGHYFCASEKIQPTVEAGGKKLPGISQIVYFYRYKNGACAAAIKAFKYQSVREIGESFCRLIVQSLDRDFFQNVVVVPVPLHRRRQNERGFNQSEVVARALGKGRVLDGLEKIVDTKAQARLDRKDRYNNLHNSFAPKNDLKKVKGKAVILVDDVITTGSTMSACAKIIALYQPKEIIGLALARD